MTDKPTPTDAAPPEPLSKRPSEANTLVWVADPISSTGVRGVFVDDITCLWWWGAGLIFQKEADAAALALRMRSAIASHGQAPAGATEPTEQQILEAAFAPAQPAAEASRFGSPELQAMIIARCVEKDQADSVQEDAADPLQGAANWLAEAHGQFSPVVLSGCLMIGYNRAKRLHDAALAARKQGENHDR